MTHGAVGCSIETVEGIVHLDAPPIDGPIAGSYGAGDSFAGALVWFLAQGLAIAEACRRAAPYGAAVLRGIDPIATQMRLT
jgi:ribokinase